MCTHTHKTSVVLLHLFNSLFSGQPG